MSVGTSLHDTLVEGMNEGTKTASEILKDMEGENRSIIRVLKSLIGIIESDIPTDMKIPAITVIAILIILQSGLGFWQNSYRLEVWKPVLEIWPRKWKKC